MSALSQMITRRAVVDTFYTLTCESPFGSRRFTTRNELKTGGELIQGLSDGDLDISISFRSSFEDYEGHGEGVVLLWWMDQRAAAADHLPEVKELFIHERHSEVQQQSKTSRDIDDKSISARFYDGQRREALLVGGWWMDQSAAAAAADLLPKVMELLTHNTF
jgi:hypothetical protein